MHVICIQHTIHIIQYIYILYIFSLSVCTHYVYTRLYIIFIYIYSIYRILKYPVTWCKSMKPEALAQLHGFTVRRQDCSGPHSRRSRLWRRHWFPARGGLAKSDGDFGEVSMISMWLQSMKVIAIVRNFERLQVHTFFLTKVPTVQNPCRTLLVCAWSFSGYENLIDRLQPQVCFTAVHKTRVVWTSGLLFCILGMSLRRVLIWS